MKEYLPELTDIPVVWLLVAAPILLWVTVGLLKRTVSLERIVENKPNPDWPGREAFAYLLKSSEWSFSKETLSNESPLLAEQYLRDRARVSQLHVWGRPYPTDGRHLVTVPSMEELRAEYWRGGEFELLSLMSPDVEKALTIPRYHSGDPIFKDIHFNKTDFIKNFPRASFIKRWRREFC